MKKWMNFVVEIDNSDRERHWYGDYGVYIGENRRCR